MIPLIAASRGATVHPDFEDDDSLTVSLQDDDMYDGLDDDEESPAAWELFDLPHEVFLQPQLEPHLQLCLQKELNVLVPVMVGDGDTPRLDSILPGEDESDNNDANSVPDLGAISSSHSSSDDAGTKFEYFDAFGIYDASSICEESHDSYQTPQGIVWLDGSWLFDDDLDDFVDLHECLLDHPSFAAPVEVGTCGLMPCGSRPTGRILPRRLLVARPYALRRRQKEFSQEEVTPFYTRLEV